MTRHQLHRLRQQQQLVRRRQAKRDRRGVLLMVVLAMLTLFLLIGTAYLVTSGHFWTSQKEAAKNNRVDNETSDEMERAVMQLLRDTNNPYSSLRGQSLLRDMYGSDGFLGRVFASDGLPQFAAQYAGAAVAPGPNGLGTTQGQFIDIYVADNIPSGFPEAGDVIRPELGRNGVTVDFTMPRANGYYAGCVLTMLEGPAAGQSTRIVDSEYIGPTSGTGALFRLRVMAFSQANGDPLTVGGAERQARPLEIAQLVGVNQNDFSQFGGYAFLVNGRPHNGTGVGFSAAASAGEPRLGALEVHQFSSPFTTPIALTPHSRFIDVSQSGALVNGRLIPLNGPGYSLYNTVEGPGGSDESYDAVDYQNMFLASMPLSPRARGGYRAVANSAVVSVAADVDPPGQFVGLDIENVPIPSFHRPALINYWYHQLVYNSFVDPNRADSTAAAAAVLLPYGMDGIRGNADDPTSIDLEIRDQIVGQKRRFTMRPLREDHPDFNGSNPLSHYQGVASPVDSSGQAQLAADSGQIEFPFWEAIGPWDVDNDGDGVPDSIWVDLGEPVQETEDGRLYKRIYSFLVVDLDNRLDMNAHGSPYHMALWNPQVSFADERDRDPTRQNVNLVGGFTSNLMPAGSGYGPADVSLRGVFAPALSTANPNWVGDSAYDDYARLLAGDVTINPDGFGRTRSEEWGRYGSQMFMSAAMVPAAGQNAIARLPNPLATLNATRDPFTIFEFEGYPVEDTLRSLRLRAPANIADYATRLSSYGQSPDLMGRYAGVGVTYGGQVVNEATWDRVFSDVDALNFPVPIPLPRNVPLVPLVDDCPYELDISFEARKDAPQGTAGNDDAPFATTELERILRGYDADAGTLPGRLWNLVDSFDPVKYGQVVAGGGTPSPVQLAFAQTMTAINRRSVTTESSYAPVPSEQVPGYISELGEDGAPGVAGEDDDDNNGDDDLGELGYRIPVPGDGSSILLTEWSDDFRALTGRSVSQARLIDVAWYRIQTSRIERSLAPYNVDNPQAVQQLNAICEQILPPEVLRGEKMNINRPFGDGQDNNANGVVDEPTEAGEPFVDANGNGLRDGNEPFINLDGSRDGRGNPTYTPPLNRFASDIPNEVATGDMVMGIDVAGSGVGGDDQHLARQLYARHLYVLMLLLTDKNYVAPYDYQDPQILRYIRMNGLDFEAAGFPEGQAKLLAQRKLTFREIAQWAINAADYRDADAICTPFEYDENPWDGWNVTVTASLADGNTNNIVFLPIDSDPATNENDGQFIDWSQINADAARVIGVRNNGNTPFQRADERTRGLVWGTERPELLITETLAWHDRRTTDDSTPNSDGHEERSDRQDNTTNDSDNDQRLRPRGSAFVELYNPWGQDSQRPIELYSRVVGGRNNTPLQIIPSEGIELGRVSNVADAQGRQSPVWRMIVVEEFPEHRNSRGTDSNPLNRKDNALHTHIATTSQNPFASYDEHRIAGLRWNIPGLPDMTLADDSDPSNQRWNFRWTNPDWTEMYYDNRYSGSSRRVPMDEWYLIAEGTENAEYNDPSDPDKRQNNEPERYQRHVFAKPYPYIEREFYFTSGNNQNFDRAGQPPTYTPFRRHYTNITPANFNRALDSIRDSGLRMPMRFVEIAPNGQRAYSFGFRFVAKTGDNDQNDVGIAPILPGRYGVIGDAGTRYESRELSDDGRPRFITTIGRIVNSDDAQHAAEGSLRTTRRIEIIPGPNPNLQQFMVAGNGAVPGNNAGDRQNEYFTTSANNYVLAADALDGNSAGTDGEPDAAVVMPTVGIPVDDFNVSEPIYGYELRELEAEDVEWRRQGDADLTWDASEAENEGAYRDEDSYDMPFDEEPELTRNVTTPNYRVMHLQRLADPTMPWNPTPDYFAHQPNNITLPYVAHDPSLPVNPYVTVDSSSVDLTAFNGTDEEDTQQLNNDERLSFYSHERGRLSAGLLVNRFSKRNSSLLTIDGNPDPAQERPILNLFAQELPRKRAQLRREFQISIPQIDAAVPGLVDQLGIRENIFNELLMHSLGYANDAFGQVYMQNRPNIDASVHAPTGPAIGMPIGAQTFQSFPWANRPFISGNELMLVPSSSQGSMLRDFTTPNPKAVNNSNPYLETGLLDQSGNPTTDLAMADPDQTNKARYAARRSYFGHLLNFFLSYNTDSDVATAGDQSISVGAPHYYRIFDYVHVPSRFSHTDTMLPPSLFNTSGSVTRAVGTITDPNDPRSGFAAPFNRVNNYSEPGRINVNTIPERRSPPTNDTPPQTWSLVYDGMMHRLFDTAATYDGGRIQATWRGHLGPAWRDVVRSRRGYPVNSESRLDVVGHTMRNEYPTLYANPFRAPGEGDLVPLQNMVRNGIESTMLRPHHFVQANPQPGVERAWGNPGVDDDGNGWMDDTSEAGLGNEAVLFNASQAQGFDPREFIQHPLFSAGALGTSVDRNTLGSRSIDAMRNPGMQYQPLTRIDNMSGTRSGVFAVWVTVGYFEVTRAPSFADVEERFTNQTGGNTAAARVLYNQVYPEGYQLGKELGIDTGESKRGRAFYVIDRTRPVGFQPGRDVNVENAILLRRRIE